MAKHGKKFQEAQKKVNPSTNYAPKDAIDLVKETSITKFDATVEIHLRTGLDPRQADQQVGCCGSSNRLGKRTRLVFAQEAPQKLKKVEQILSRTAMNGSRKFSRVH